MLLKVLKIPYNEHVTNEAVSRKIQEIIKEYDELIALLKKWLPCPPRVKNRNRKCMNKTGLGGNPALHLITNDSSLSAEQENLDFCQTHQYGH